MNDPRAVNRSSSCYFRWAAVLAVASSCLFATAENEADAAWWPFPSKRKSADDAGPKSNSGFNGTIRKLMKDAKAEEEQGNLDKAIALADRAAKVSEASSNFTKTAPDVSPSTTARYAHDLRLKKAEQSVKRGSVTPAAKQTAEKSTQTAKSADKASKPPAKKVVATRTADTPVEKKVARKDPEREPTVEATKPRKPQPPVSNVAQDNVGDYDITADLAMTKTTRQTRPTKTLDPQIATISAWDEDSAGIDDNGEKPTSVAMRAADMDAESPTEASDATVSTKSADDEDPFETSTEPTMEPRHQLPSIAASSTLKLRKQYSSENLGDSRDVMETIGSDTGSAERPTITPMIAFSQDSADAHDSEVIVPIVAKDSPKEESKLPRSKDPKSKPSKDEVTMRVTSSTRDGADLNDLQKRLQSAALLEPGAVAPELRPKSFEGKAWDTTADERVAETRVIKLRKRRPIGHELQRVEVAPVETAKVREPVVGRAALVQWRPAKTDAPPAMRPTPQPESKIARMPADLRQSLHQMSTAGFNGTSSSKTSLASLPSIEFGRDSEISSAARETARDDSSTKTRWHGSTWDHAPTPANEGVTRTGNHGSKRIDLNSSSLAPLPPPDPNFELTSFDQPNELSKSHHAEGSNDDSESSFASWSASNGDTQFLPDLERPASSTDQTAPDNSKSASGHFQRISAVLQVFGGFAIFIAGLWLVRAVVRSKTLS